MLCFKMKQDQRKGNKMNKQKLTQLKNQLVREVRKMQNTIATGPKVFGVRQANTNDERIAIFERYKQIRNEYFKKDKTLEMTFGRLDMHYCCVFNEPIAKILIYRSESACWKARGFLVVDA